MRRTYLLTGLAIVATACSSPEPLTSTAQANITTISIQDFYYSPASVSVKAGSVVQWVNRGPSVHTATSDNGVWDSGEIGALIAGTPGTAPRPGSTPPPDTTVSNPGANPETPLPIPPGGSSPDTPLPIPSGGSPDTPLPIPPGNTPGTPLPSPPPGNTPGTPLPSPPPGNTPGTPLPPQPPGNTPGTPLPLPPGNERSTAASAVAAESRLQPRRPLFAVGTTYFQFTFDTPGTYTFHCSIHPPATYPNFVGTVVVTN